MAETLVSPGVLARENDQSFITQQPVQVGAAIVGPTVKGPVEVPTLVTSYSDYQNRFGTTFDSGSEVYSYFTSIAAYNYFNNGGNTLLVTRVVSGSANSWQYASASITAGATVGDIAATASMNLGITIGFGTNTDDEFRFAYSGTTYRFVTADPAGGLPADQAPLYFLATGSTSTAYAGLLETKIDAVLSSLIDATNEGSGVLSVTASAAGTGFNGVIFQTGSSSTFSTAATAGGGTDITTTVTSFVLEAIDKGVIWNNSGSILSGGALASGSVDNVRWQIVTANTSSGTFSLVIRSGRDTNNNPSVLETWNNLSLDPNSDNFISRVIGDTKFNYNDSEIYLEVSGSYPNASRYVRVKSVTTTPNYLDNAGNAKDIYTGSIPNVGSGSIGGAFQGGVGSNISKYTDGGNYYELAGNNSGFITGVTQGLVGTDYSNMLNLLSNQDDYLFNVLLTPGLFNSKHSSQTTTAINNTQGRGDSIYVLDPVTYGSTITATTTQAASRNTSYAAMYWPWLQTIDPDSSKNVWVPASTMIGGVYAYNDSVSEPWFAPAGINRGGLGNVIRPERKLTQSNRDTLYQENINPIASFPGTGTVVYGQKTLQRQASALDRVNVRRLLISLKGYIGQVAQNLVFEQNTAATRNNFLAAVNPYLESVQQRQGLYAFKVVMDDSNNTPDVIDRNQLVGAIYLQPTRTAEFIILDFNVLPTGATFPA